MDEGNWKPAVSKDIKNPRLNDLLDDRTAQRLVNELKQGLPKAPNPVVSYKKGKSATRPAKSDDLLSSMAARLSQQEKVNSSLRKEIQQKSNQIQSLTIEIQTLKQAASPDAVEQFTSIQTENAKLREQIREMEQFLSDYGLKWVGKEGNLDVNAINEALSGSEPMYRYNLPREIDIAVLERRISELNIIAEKDASRFVSEGGIHRFKAPDSIAVVFFKNGLILQGSPFRPYSSNEAQSLLSDLLDGYFPFDLKRKYPDGVPLRLVDKTSETFSTEKHLHSIDDPDLGFLSKEEFLNEFPENVIRRGEIIPIREDLEKILGGPQTGNIEVWTHVDEFIEDEPGNYDGEISCLRIKTETGKKNLVMKLWLDDPVSRIAGYINPYKESSADYEIRSTFPARVYDKNGSETLRQLEMYPSYALVIKSL